MEHARDASRRLGRMELLLLDISRLSSGYEPSAAEAAAAHALMAKLTEIYLPTKQGAIESSPPATRRMTKCREK
jgi:hypothetical protein